MIFVNEVRNIMVYVEMVIFKEKNRKDLSLPDLVTNLNQTESLSHIKKTFI